MMFGPAAGMAILSISPLTMWLSCGALGLIAAAIILRLPQVARTSAAA